MPLDFLKRSKNPQNRGGIKFNHSNSNITAGGE